MKSVPSSCIYFDSFKILIYYLTCFTFILVASLKRFKFLKMFKFLDDQLLVYSFQPNIYVMSFSLELHQQYYYKIVMKLMWYYHTYVSSITFVKRNVTLFTPKIFSTCFQCFLGFFKIIRVKHITDKQHNDWFNVRVLSLVLQKSYIFVMSKKVRRFLVFLFCNWICFYEHWI